MEIMTHINDSTTMEFPSIGKKRSNKAKLPVQQQIPEGYMSLEQFEQELVAAVIKKL